MLDGCTAASADWKIRLPLLRNIIQYDLITGVIGTLCIYALIEVISVTYAKYTTVPMLEIVNTSMKKLQFGMGCAMAVVFFIECLVVSIICIRQRTGKILNTKGAYEHETFLNRKQLGRHGFI